MRGRAVTMALAESSRRLLHESAVAALGTEAADVLMEHLPPAGWTDLARRSDVEHETALLRLEIGTLGTEMRGEFVAVRAEMAGEFATVRAEMAGGFAALRADMAGGFAAVRAEMAGEFAAVRAEMAGEFAAVRADMAGGFAAVRAELRTEIQAAVAKQTRLMLTMLVVLGALYSTVNVLGR